MKKILLCIFFLDLLLLSSCNQNAKSKKLYNQACTMIQSANIAEWTETSREKDEILAKLDMAINLEPTWWAPYKEKIQIYKIGSCDENAKQVNEVYSLWIKNNNNLEGFTRFSYACSLYCSGSESKALCVFNELFSEVKEKNMTEEEKIIYLLSGIVIGSITESNLHDCVLSVFDDSMVSNIDDFFIFFRETPKEALWVYV